MNNKYKEILDKITYRDIESLGIKGQHITEAIRQYYIYKSMENDYAGFRRPEDFKQGEQGFKRGESDIRNDAEQYILRNMIGLGKPFSYYKHDEYKLNITVFNFIKRLGLSKLITINEYTFLNDYGKDEDKGISNRRFLEGLREVDVLEEND